MPTISDQQLIFFTSQAIREMRAEAVSVGWVDTFATEQLSVERNQQNGAFLTRGECRVYLPLYQLDHMPIETFVARYIWPAADALQRIDEPPPKSKSAPREGVA